MSDGQIILSKYHNAPVITGFIDGKMEFLSFDRKSQVHEVYLGKVDHIVKNLNAAFIRYGQDSIGYLSLQNISNVCVTNRNIEEKAALKSGDEVIVQIESEAIKSKKSKLTTSLSISGKYSVITLGRSGVGASLKLNDAKRKALIDITKSVFESTLKSFQKENNLSFSAGLIVRTNAVDIPEESYISAITEDIAECLKRISLILTEGRKRTIYSLLYSPENSSLDKAKAFLRNRGITDFEVIEDTGIHGINSKIDSLRQNKIWLKSGAFLIIEQLESFNAIDVNTGKAIKGKKDISMAVNLEAADEIMRQVRLRNLTGMILIDFINMKVEKNYEILIEHMTELCRNDPIHTNFVDVTGLGIMELTRNKNDKSLKEILQEVENAVDNR